MSQRREVGVLTKRGFIDVNKMAIRVPKIFSEKLSGAKIQRIIFLIMKDLSQFSDEKILEFVKRAR